MRRIILAPICMPIDENAKFTNRTASVSGWGQLRYGGKLPSVLQKVEVTVTLFISSFYTSLKDRSLKIICVKKCGTSVDIIRKC